MSDDDNKPLTNTEYLACFVGMKMPLREIRHNAYESGKRMAKYHCIFDAREASKWASGWVQKFDEEMDLIFL